MPVFWKSHEPFKIVPTWTAYIPIDEWSSSTKWIISSVCSISLLQLINEWGTPSSWSLRWSSWGHHFKLIFILRKKSQKFRGSRIILFGDNFLSEAPSSDHQGSSPYHHAIRALWTLSSCQKYDNLVCTLITTPLINIK